MGWWLTVDWMAPVKRSGKGLEEKGGWGLKVGLMMVVAVVVDSPEIGNNIKEIMASSSSSKIAIPSTSISKPLPGYSWPQVHALDQEILNID
ncbi:hypothetical protein E3N88_28377 [Mikania micrantha]|uniref:Uncharacterized protein n=1 Tax=Mikania micrantha TaxID=192012 RepID=A0A5N6N0B2_9ASTR|nr:hypothetical protein E3N88_28377 [Mikania micrantha]